MRAWSVSRSRVAGLALILATASPAARADGPPPGTEATVPDDFKLEITEFGAGTKPVATAQVVARDGRCYQFTERNNEVIVVDPRRARVEMVDIRLRLQTSLTFDELASARARLREALRKSIDRRVEKGGRSNQELARITQDLLEPRFQVSDGTKPGQLRLVNKAVEVDAAGEADPDADRLRLIGVTLDAIADLGAYRVPTDLPPFAELDAIHVLVRDRKLRPTELSYLYRLAGPPRRLRRTYQVIAELSDREREAITRIDQLREQAQIARYERYVRRIAEPRPGPTP